MKCAMRLIAAILSGILLLGLAACDTPDPSPAPTEPPIPAIKAYDTATERLKAAPNRVLVYTVTTTCTAGGQTYTEKVEGKASFSKVGTEEMVAVVQENWDYDTLSANYLLSFCNGRAYSRISGSTFGADMGSAEFLASQLPVVLIDSTLYTSIGRVPAADGTSIMFHQPKALESWVNAPADATNVKAYGSALLDKNGALVQTTYQVTYACGGAEFAVTATLNCTTPAQLELSALHPEHPEDYVMLACLDAPRLLLRAADHILTANKLTASASETIYSQIIPLTQERKSEIRLSGWKETLSAQLSNTVTVTDYREQPSTTKQVYDFISGVCSSTVDDGTPMVQPGITAETMRTSMEDSLLSALFATRYLAGATLTEDEDVYRLDFAGNDAYCEDLTRDLSAFFNLSLEGVTSHRDTVASGYLCIDKASGLPVAMGMYFTRTHISGDVPYVMSYQLDQVISLTPED